MGGESYVIVISQDMGVDFKLHAKLKDKVYQPQALQPGSWPNRGTHSDHLWLQRLSQVPHNQMELWGSICPSHS